MTFRITRHLGGASKGFFVTALLVAALGILGCENQGPAEEAGEKIDQTAEDAGDKMEETKQSLTD
jgi:hyperosmotically inducible protein